MDNIFEVKDPMLNAALVGETIALQLEKRIAYRRAIKQALAKAEERQVKGMKIRVSGRLNGAEIARTEIFGFGSMPLQTLRSAVDFAQASALTTYGIIGVKVWIFQGDKK